MIFKENSRRKWLTIIYVVAFFLLEILIVTNSPFIGGIDHAAQDIFSAITSPFNTKIFSFITFLGSPLMDVIYLIIMMLLLYRMGKKDSSFWIGFVLIGGNIISYLIKITVKRSRPTGKIIPASGFSFPSGHVFGTMLVIMTLIFLVLPMFKSLSNRHTINVLLIIWLIVVAISRVYLRGHFLSDTVGSMLLAGAWWECSVMLHLKYYDSIGNILKLNNSDQ